MLSLMFSVVTVNEVRQFLIESLIIEWAFRCEYFFLNIKLTLIFKSLAYPMRTALIPRRSGVSSELLSHLLSLEVTCF